jgi:hypothetical protein
VRALDTAGLPSHLKGLAFGAGESTPMLKKPDLTAGKDRHQSWQYGDNQQ